MERGPGARISSATLDGPALASALRQVRPAAETDPASPLASVLVDVDEESCDVVATNRYWMAVRTVPATPDAARLADAVDGTASARLEISDGTLSVRCDDDAVLTTGRGDVAYPAHRLVLAGLESTTTRAVLDAGRLMEVVCSVGRAELDLEVACADRPVGMRSPYQPGFRALAMPIRRPRDGEG